MGERRNPHTKRDFSCGEFSDAIHAVCLLSDVYLRKEKVLFPHHCKYPIDAFRIRKISYADGAIHILPLLSVGRKRRLCFR